jgi:hypothetical protein
MSINEMLSCHEPMEGADYEAFQGQTPEYLASTDLPTATRRPVASTALHDHVMAIYKRRSTEPISIPDLNLLFDTWLATDKIATRITSGCAAMRSLEKNIILSAYSSHAAWLGGQVDRSNVSRCLG